MILRLTNFLFLLLIFSLGFMQPNYHFQNYQITLTDFIFPIVFLFWILSVLLGQSRIKQSWFYFPLGLYFLSLTISTVFSESPQRSLVKFFGEIYLLGLAVLGFNLVNSMRDVKRICYAWLSVTFVINLVTLLTIILFYTDKQNPLLQYTLSIYGSLPPGNYPRIHTTFFNANMLCNYLNISLMFILAAYRLQWINRLIFIILLISTSVSIFFTLSPGIGGILLSVGIWYWLFWRKEGKFLPAKLSLTAGISGAILCFLSVLPSISDFSRLALSSRVLLWISAFNTFLANPFVGRGIGLDAAYIVYVDGSGTTQYLLDAHQLWLNVAAQQGIIGFVAICILCIFIVRQFLKFGFDSSPLFVIRFALGMAFAGSFLYQGLMGSFEDARHLWVLIALVGILSDDKFSKNFSPQESSV